MTSEYTVIIHICRYYIVKCIYFLFISSYFYVVDDSSTTWYYIGI